MARRRKEGKFGRNDACHCGSGKKYKRCCLLADKQRQRAGVTVPQPLPIATMVWTDDDDLERITNGVIGLINAGNLDDAEQTCEELRRRWPNMIDWIDRLALVREAQGRYADAAALNRQAAEFAQSHDGFDVEGTQWFLDAASRQERLASAE